MKKLLLIALLIVGCSSSQPQVGIEHSDLDIEIFDEGDPFPENYCIKDEIFIIFPGRFCSCRKNS